MLKTYWDFVYAQTKNSKMSLKVRLFLLLSGCFILFAWGFRLYVLAVRWSTDPFRISTISFAVIYLFIGLFLVSLGRRGSMVNRKNYTQLIYVAFFLILYWAYRLGNLLLYPDLDPNPRAHLHLSVTFIVIGALLLAVGRTGMKKDKLTKDKLTEATPLG
jgi:hypothetical protein